MGKTTGFIIDNVIIHKNKMTFVEKHGLRRLGIFMFYRDGFDIKGIIRHIKNDYEIKVWYDDLYLDANSIHGTYNVMFTK